eukprot:Colp12_sorted_trinity150504_noHs@1407
MEDINIDRMYESYYALDGAQDKIGEHSSDYAIILLGTQGDGNCKKLACQFIPKFFKHFPNMADDAMNAQIDMCEEDDAQIRKEAIRGLAKIGKDEIGHTAKIADLLTQLLQTDDKGELDLVQTSLLALFSSNLTGAASGFFYQVVHGEDLVRDRALALYHGKLVPALYKTLMPSADEEAFLAEEIYKVLEDVTGSEFTPLVESLKALRLFSVPERCLQLLRVLEGQADVESGNFKAEDTEVVDCLVTCTKQTLSLYEKGIPSDSFLRHLTLHVLPVLSNIANVAYQYELLKCLAELASFNFAPETAAKCVRPVYDALVAHTPSPPSEGGEATATVNANFAVVECLLFTFHRVARKEPTFLGGEGGETKARLAALSARLHVTAKAAREWAKSPGTFDTQTAARINNNIQALVKDLTHPPHPTYSVGVPLSWTSGQKITTLGTVSSAGERKRSVDIGAKESKPKRRALQLYQPPRGKAASDTPTNGESTSQSASTKPRPSPQQDNTPIQQPTKTQPAAKPQPTNQRGSIPSLSAQS